MDVHGSVRNGFGVCGWCKLTKFVEHYGIVSMVALNGCHQVEVVSSFSCIKNYLDCRLGRIDGGH